MSGRVRAEGLGKRFASYQTDRAWTLKQAMIHGWRKSDPVDHLWAVRDIEFEIKPGEMLGLVGNNGAGKSTLMRLVGGVLKPDEGKVETSGSISGLLELNTGMHPDLSGRDNLMIGGVVAGLSRREVLAKFDEIVAFAELERFIDNPFRSYSAGMKLRLGFAVAVHGRPGILLIDEILSVGDGAFQAKCLKRIQRFKEEGSAIILSSHDLRQVASMCERVLWLSDGRQLELDTADIVINKYRTEIATRILGTEAPKIDDEVTDKGVALQSGKNRFGTMECRIASVRLLDLQGTATETIEAGSGLAIEVTWTSELKDGAPVLAISFQQGEIEKIIDVNNIDDGILITAKHGANKTVLFLDRVDLFGGEYQLNVGLYAEDWSRTFDYHYNAYTLVVTSSVSGASVLDPPRRWLLA